MSLSGFIWVSDMLPYNTARRYLRAGLWDYETSSPFGAFIVSWHFQHICEIYVCSWAVNHACVRGEFLSEECALEITVKCAVLNGQWLRGNDRVMPQVFRNPKTTRRDKNGMLLYTYIISCLSKTHCQAYTNLNSSSSLGLFVLKFGVTAAMKFGHAPYWQILKIEWLWHYSLTT